MSRPSPTETSLPEALENLETGAGSVPTLRIANGMPLTLEPTEVRRDGRARRPQLSSALRQSQAPQRFARFASLLALDFGAVFAAIFTALAVKELVRGS